MVYFRLHACILIYYGVFLTACILWCILDCMHTHVAVVGVGCVRSTPRCRTKRYAHVADLAETRIRTRPVPSISRCHALTREAYRITGIIVILIKG